MTENLQLYEQRNRITLNDNHLQPCPVCEIPMGDMPGSRDAYCSNCGYKDPCCE